MTRRQAGFTYRGLLFAVALAGAALAQIGQHWSGLVQRERERELIFRGQQIAAAIASYRAVAGVAAPAWPRGFGDLLDDRRTTVPQRHLRQVYSDPFTGQPDWVLMRDEAGGWQGVHSRVERPASIRVGLEFQGQGARRTKLSDHLFVAPLQAGAASAPLPAVDPDTAQPQ